MSEGSGDWAPRRNQGPSRLRGSRRALPVSPWPPHVRLVLGPDEPLQTLRGDAVLSKAGGAPGFEAKPHGPLCLNPAGHTPPPGPGTVLQPGLSCRGCRRLPGLAQILGSSPGSGVKPTFLSVAGSAGARQERLSSGTEGTREAAPVPSLHGSRCPIGASFPNRAPWGSGEPRENT